MNEADDIIRDTHSLLDNTTTDTEKHSDTATPLNERTSTSNTFTCVDILCMA